jgi:lipid-A-disaccharide synthase
MTDAPAPRLLSLYFIAAEESGDALGAALIRALKAAYRGPLDLAGVGGRAMAAAGVVSPFAIEDLSIVGLGAIPQRLPAILRRIRETADTITAKHPDALVIIDSPEFTHRVARRVRRQVPSIPILDYVSPSVWAWRPWRARAMRSYVDQVMAILPFEPAAHARLGGPACVYVGHPLIERIGELRPNAEEAQRRHADPPVVLLLPGSRRSEIRQLLGTFGSAIALAANRTGPIELILPTLPHLEAEVARASAGWAVRPRIVVDAAEKWAAFRIARVALAASGTVTLELALAGVPTVAAYRLPLFEEILARLMGLNPKRRSVILANLVLGENAVPELLQRDCKPQRLADTLVPLLSDTPQRRRQSEAFQGIDLILGVADKPPSAKAATVVLDVAQRGRR